MLAVPSVLPLVAIAAVVVIAVSFITIPRPSAGGWRLHHRFLYSGPRDGRGKCGFNLGKPGRLTSSLGTHTLRISDDDLAVRTPLGDYQWSKAGASLSPVRRRAFAVTFRVADQDTEADVLVRDGDLLAAALHRHDWATTAA